MNHILLAATNSNKIEGIKSKILERELLFIRDTQELYIKLNNDLVKIGGPTSEIINNVMYNPRFFVGPTEEYESYQNNLEDGALCIIDNKVYVRRDGTLREVIPIKGEMTDGGFVVYNEASNTFETTEAAKIDSDGTATIKNLIVTDNATITHAKIITEENVESKDDFIILRKGNTLPTPESGAGIQINNYDGNDNNLNLITTSDGTLRVGEPGSEEPVLTRAEENEMSNGAPLVWDAANLKAVTTPAIHGNHILRSVLNNNTGAISYEWSLFGDGMIWRGTRAEFEAALKITDPDHVSYIQNNAMIIITDDEEEYLELEEWA